jgi:propanol-preferring alcohol dehydrogenase
MDMLRFGGTLVCAGIPEGDPLPIAKAFPQLLIGKALKIVGVAVGDRKDAIEVLDLAARGVIKTHFRTEKMENLTEVFEQMHKGEVAGRVVLDLQS